jgi:hypothetical protein
MTITPAPPDYAAFLAGLKDRILRTRTSAARAVNRDLILLYWEIGRSIAEKQQTAGWGEAVVERLSKDLQTEFPDMRGFSVGNVWRMKQFYLSHASPEFLSQAVRDLKLIETGAELPAAIPWWHHVELLAKVKDVRIEFDKKLEKGYPVINPDIASG